MQPLLRKLFPGKPSVPADASPSHPVAKEGLSVRAIRKAFRDREVVRGVDLDLCKGKVVGLLGPNGAGKTTCFYMITGLLAADSGVIALDGANVTALPMFQRARLGIGYLPQEPSIFRGMTVEENILSVVELVEKNRSARMDRTNVLLKELRIERLRNSPAPALSGGERRRCEIARALAMQPSYILLDEPFAGIDPLAIADIRELIVFLKARGIGVLITDHNVRETLDIVDHASIIYDGKVLFEGSPDAVMNNADVRRVYLGQSFTN